MALSIELPRQSFLSSRCQQIHLTGRKSELPLRKLRKSELPTGKLRKSELPQENSGRCGLPQENAELQVV